MTAMSKEELNAMPVEFKLNGKDVVAHGGETIIQAAKRHGVEIPHLCYKEGLRPDGNCRACVVEVKGERVLAASCCRKPAQGHGGHDRQRARRALAEDGARAAALRHPGGAAYARLGARPLGEGAQGRQAALRAAPPAGRRSLAPRHRGQSRFLHPVHALPARLPRGAGERRDRLRVPRRALEDRVRSRRPDGRLDVRRVRRMRAGVPDRRAHAGARRRAGEARQAGALGVPVLRRRLPAHLRRSRTTRSSTSKAATARPITSACA